MSKANLFLGHPVYGRIFYLIVASMNILVNSNNNVAENTPNVDCPKLDVCLLILEYFNPKSSKVVKSTISSLLLSSDSELLHVNGQNILPSSTSRRQKYPEVV